MDWTMDWIWTGLHEIIIKKRCAPLAQSSGIGKEFVTFQSQSDGRMTQ